MTQTTASDPIDIRKWETFLQTDATGKLISGYRMIIIKGIEGAVREDLTNPEIEQLRVSLKRI